MSIYTQIYSILHEYIFGLAELTTAQDSALSLISLAFCSFIVFIPFVLVWRVIKLLLGE